MKSCFLRSFRDTTSPAVFAADPPVIKAFDVFDDCSVYVTLCACSKSELGGGNVRKPQKYTYSQQELSPSVEGAGSSFAPKA